MYAQLQHSCQHSRSSFDVVSMKGDLPNVSTRLAFWFTDSPVSQYLPQLAKASLFTRCTLITTFVSNVDRIYNSSCRNYEGTGRM